MTNGEEKWSGLIPVQSTAVARVGANSLAARARADLRIREDAHEWLRKGLELQRAAPAVPRYSHGPINPYAAPPTDLSTKLLTTIPAYLKLVLGGNPPDVAANNLRMTPEDQETAHVAHHIMPETFAKLVKQEEETREQVLTKRAGMLTEAFQCFEKGHQLDSMNPELLCCLAECYLVGSGVDEDEKEALNLYQQAADMGYATAQTAIGDAHAQSGFSCLPRHESKAAKWYALAAEQGDQEALCMIVGMYQRGNGMELDHTEAARLLRAGAAGGDDTASHNLKVYANRYGPPYDDGAVRAQSTQSNPELSTQMPSNEERLADLREVKWIQNEEQSLGRQGLTKTSEPPSKKLSLEQKEAVLKELKRIQDEERWQARPATAKRNED